MFFSWPAQKHTLVYLGCEVTRNKEDEKNAETRLLTDVSPSHGQSPIFLFSKKQRIFPLLAYKLCVLCTYMYVYVCASTMDVLCMSVRTSSGRRLGSKENGRHGWVSLSVTNPLLKLFHWPREGFHNHLCFSHSGKVKMQVSLPSPYFPPAHESNNRRMFFVLEISTLRALVLMGSEILIPKRFSRGELSQEETAAKRENFKNTGKVSNQGGHCGKDSSAQIFIQYVIHSSCKNFSSIPEGFHFWMTARAQQW